MAENIKRHVTHIKSKVIENGLPKLPTASQIQEGEIAVNYAKGYETLSIKNESGDVITFSSDNYYSDKKLGSAFTGSNSAVTVTEALENVEIDVDQVIDSSTSASTNAVATKAVYDVIVDNELVWTNAYAAMSGIVSAHTASTEIHLTAADRQKIDNIPTFGSMAAEDKDDYYTKSATSGASEISSALNGKVDTSDFNTHTGDTTIHVTSSEKSSWNSAASNSHTHTNKAALDAITGSVGTMAYENATSYSSATQVNTALTSKSDTGHTHDDRYYTESEIDTIIEEISGSSTGATNKTITAITQTDGVVTPTYADISITKSQISDFPTIPTVPDNIVTGTNLTAGNVIVGNGNSAISASSIQIETALTNTLDTKIPTSKAIATYVGNEIDSALTSVLSYKGTVNSNSDLPATHKVGDVYVVATNGTYVGKTCEVGDYIICKSAGTAASDADWDVVNGENQVSNSAATLVWDSAVTIATVDGTDITVKLPQNPDTNTWRNVKVNGTQKLDTATGATSSLDFTTGSTNGTISVAGTDVSVKGLDTAAYKKEEYFAGSGHTHDASGITSMKGYSKPSTTSAIATGDSLNTAIGKLERAIDDATAGGVTSVSLTSGTNNGTLKLTVNSNETDNIAVTGLGGAAYLNTGTTSNTVAAGDHTHSEYITEVSGTTPISVSKTNSKINITHSTSNGYKHIPSNGSNGQFLGYSDAGTAQWVNNPNTDNYITGATVSGNGEAVKVSLSGNNNSAKANASFTLSAVTETNAGLMTADMYTSIGQDFINIYSGMSDISTAVESVSGSVEGLDQYIGSLGLDTLGEGAYMSTGTTSGTLATGDHTHGLGITSSSSNASITLGFGNKYQLSAGGSTYIFQMPSSASSWNSVTSVTTSSTNGNISVNGSNVKVAGLGGAAYLGTGTTSNTVAAGDHTHDLSIASTSTTANVTLAAATKYKLTAGGNTYVFQTPSDSNNRRCFYATCGTAANTYAKVATLSSTDGWELSGGTVVGVKYTNTNSYTASTYNITLNVNSSGAKNIVYKGTTNPTKPNPSVYGTAGRVIYYMYDGTNWVWMGMDGYGDAAFLNTGTTAGTVAAGDHTHSGYAGTGTSVLTASGLTGGGNLSTNRTIGLAATGTAGTYYAVKTDSYGRVISGSTTAPSTDSWRSIKINGTEFLTTATTSSALNLSGKTNITLTTGSTGLVSISATTGETSSTVAVGNHTHSTYQLIATSGTAAQLSAGTDTTQRVWTAKNIKDGIMAVSGTSAQLSAGTSNTSYVWTPKALKDGIIAMGGTGATNIALGNHTHSGYQSTSTSGTAAQLSAGTDTTQRVWTAKNLKDGIVALGYQTSSTSGTSAQLSAGTDTTQRVWTAAQIKGGTDALYASKNPPTYSATTYTSTTITSTEPIVYALVRKNTTTALNNQVCPVALVDGQQCNVIYQSTGTSAYDVVISTTNYKTTDNQGITLNVPANGYAEINYINIKGVIFARGV